MPAQLPIGGATKSTWSVCQKRHQRPVDHRLYPNAVHLNENPVHLSLAVDKSASVSMPRKVPWADLERYVNRIGLYPKDFRTGTGRAAICSRPQSSAGLPA